MEDKVTTNQFHNQDQENPTKEKNHLEKFLFRLKSYPFLVEQLHLRPIFKDF